MIPLAAAMLFSWATGALIVWMLSPRPRSPWSVCTQLCIAMALGLAISSGVFFFARSALHYDDVRLLLLDAGLLVALCILSVVTNRSGPSADFGNIERPASSERPAKRTGLKALRIAATLAVIATFAFAILCFYDLCKDRPHGNWDAWAMWNMKARFIYRGGANWMLAFSNEMSGVRPDYPLLLPLTVARAWACLGGDSTFVPRAMAALFTLLTFLIVSCSVGRARGFSTAALAATALLGSAVFIDEGASQYADMPLACFITATVVLITAACEAKHGMNRLWTLAGLAAGAAAWTKNEGLLFCCVCMCVVALAGWWSRCLRHAIGRTALFLIGASPMLACVLATKLAFGWKNDLFQDRPVGELVRLVTNPARWTAVAHWFLELIPQIIHPALIAIVALLALVGWRHARKAQTGRSDSSRHGPRIASLCLLLMALGYLIIYLTTPHDIGWHMRTSFSRLVLHLWPATLFIVFHTGPTLHRPIAPSTAPAPAAAQ